MLRTFLAVALTALLPAQIPKVAERVAIQIGEVQRLGHMSKDEDASERIWRFFARFQR